MTNWLVPVIWVLGMIYMLYYICVECRDSMQEFGAIVKTAVSDQPGRVTFAVIAVIALLEIIAACWPVFVSIDVGRAIYFGFKGDEKTK